MLTFQSADSHGEQNEGSVQRETVRRSKTEQRQSVTEESNEQSAKYCAEYVHFATSGSERPQIRCRESIKQIRFCSTWHRDTGPRDESNACDCGKQTRDHKASSKDAPYINSSEERGPNVQP